jgi:hypothetical protein
VHVLCGPREQLAERNHVVLELRQLLHEFVCAQPVRRLVERRRVRRFHLESAVHVVDVDQLVLHPKLAIEGGDTAREDERSRQGTKRTRVGVPVHFWQQNGKWSIIQHLNMCISYAYHI